MAIGGCSVNNRWKGWTSVLVEPLSSKLGVTIFNLVLLISKNINTIFVELKIYFILFLILYRRALGSADYRRSIEQNINMFLEKWRVKVFVLPPIFTIFYFVSSKIKYLRFDCDEKSTRNFLIETFCRHRNGKVCFKIVTCPLIVTLYFQQIGQSRGMRGCHGSQFL